MRVFIGCSSIENMAPIYKENAVNLAKKLAKMNCDLICGGTDGMMKIFHDTFLQNNRTVTIVDVNGYFETKTTSPNIYHYDTVSERKQGFIKQADVLLFLPGGLGTLDEIFTAIESKRAKEHSKPIIILNINNYYDDLIHQLDKMYQERFASIDNKEYYLNTKSIDEVIQHIRKLR